MSRASRQSDRGRGAVLSDRSDFASSKEGCERVEYRVKELQSFRVSASLIRDERNIELTFTR